MTIGHKQQCLIDIGNSKGFVDSNDILKYYNLPDGKRAMNSLIILGHFKEEKLDEKCLKIIWEKS